MRGIGGAAMIMLGLWVSASAPAVTGEKLPDISVATAAAAATDVIVADNDVGVGASITAVSSDQ